MQWYYPRGCATPGLVQCQGNTFGHMSKLKVAPTQRKIDVTSKSPVGDISVVTLIRTDTTLDHSQKAEKVWNNMASASNIKMRMKTNCSFLKAWERDPFDKDTRQRHLNEDVPTVFGEAKINDRRHVSTRSQRLPKAPRGSPELPEAPQSSQRLLTAPRGSEASLRCQNSLAQQIVWSIQCKNSWQWPFSVLWMI